MAQPRKQLQLPSLSTLVLLHILPAFLPSIPPNERTYYDILKVPSSASQDDIRKAFRSISLKLHPDKRQQRGQQNDTEEADEEYQKVQEAYYVLSDSRKRNEYNQWKASPTLYQYVSSSSLYNPQSVLENLIRSTPNAKTRLVLLLLVMTCLLLLQPILIGVKLNHILQQNGGALESTPWIIIFIPTWFMQGMYSIGLVILLTMVETNKLRLTFSCIGNISWLVGLILLTLQWDRTIDSKFAILFIPFYIYLITKYITMMLSMGEIKHQVNRMVTLTELEPQLGNPLSDLTEEEREAVEQDYHVIHHAATVEESPEFEAAMDELDHTHAQLWKAIAMEIPLLILILLKIDDDGPLQDTNWWLIFMPMWISFFFSAMTNCYSCCWAVGTQIIVMGPLEENGQDDAALQTPTNNQQNVDVLPSTTPAYVPPNLDDTAKTPIMEKTTTTNTTTAAVSTPTKAAASLETFDNEFSPSPTNATPGEKSSSVVDDTNDDAQGDNTMDEETFEEWKQAYQEAQSSAQETQAKAQLNCCALLAQILMMGLVVGKLQQAYASEESQGNGGFNAMWVLFPMFLFAGCTLSCCACLIYGVGEGVLQTSDPTDDEEAEKAAENTIIVANNEAPANETQTITVGAPPPAATATAPAAPTGFDADELD